MAGKDWKTARHWLRQRFLGKDPRYIGNEKKNTPIGLYQAKKLLHCTGDHQQSEEASKRKYLQTMQYI